MWLNKNYNSQAESFAEKGTVTLGGTANVDAGEGNRNAEVYAPYGYSFCAPAGEEVLIIGSQSDTNLSFTFFSNPFNILVII